MRIILLGSNKCLFCLKIKNKLLVDKVDFEYIDVDTESGNKIFQELFKVTNSDLLPQVVLGNIEKPLILVPNIAFNTIDELYDVIKKQM